MQEQVTRRLTGPFNLVSFLIFLLSGVFVSPLLRRLPCLRSGRYCVSLSVLSIVFVNLKKIFIFVLVYKMM